MLSLQLLLQGAGHMTDEYFYQTSLVAYIVMAALCGWYVLRFASIRSERFKIVSANAVLFIYLVSTVYLVGETYYRFVYDLSDSMNITLTSLQWYKRHFRYNNAGFRDNTDYSLKVPEGKMRVSFLGDSFTAGAGINNVEKRFVNIFRKDTSWDVHSLATCGDDTLKEMAVVEKLSAIGYRTNYFVLVFNLNDATEISQEGSDAMRRIISNYESDSLLRNRSYFIDTMYYRYKRLHDPEVMNHFRMLPNDYQGATWDRLTGSLLQLDRLVRSQDAHLLVVIFPLVHAINKDRAYPYQYIHSRMTSFLQANGIPHLDLLEPLMKHRDEPLTANKYDGHPNELAHRVAAVQIKEFVEQQTGRLDQNQIRGNRQ
jgi:hypothetical protein